MGPVRHLLIACCWLAIASDVVRAQAVNIQEFLGDLNVVEKETAEAKKVRLDWITNERDRLREQMGGYEKELKDLRDLVPDAAKKRKMSAVASKAREIEEKNFNSWVATNDPNLRMAIVHGEGLNALLRVLGPIAHYRKSRTDNPNGVPVLPALARLLKPTDAEHYRLNPATSAGSKFVIRPNLTPLELESLPYIVQNFGSDWTSIGKARDAYVASLGVAGNSNQYLEHADLLDKSVTLLQAKIVREKSQMFANKSINSKKKVDTFRDMQDALRYLETVRVRTDQFKRAPAEYRVCRFAGGSIEDLLDFCFTHGMFFETAQRSDESYYWQLHVLMKDYAKDLQFVEDWKSDIEQRILELDARDQKLVWAASQQ